MHDQRPMTAPGAQNGDGQRRESTRRRLRTLDACLNELENAHERGEIVLDPPLALVLQVHVADVRPGLSIAQAIELVLAEQARCMASSNADEWPVRRAAPQRMSRPHVTANRLPGRVEALAPDAARVLTERIKAAAGHVCLLLQEAHERRAWAALGYPTWEAYVRDEFHFSRRRSYELLEQARVLTMVKQIAELPDVPTISAYAAGQIKEHVDEVAQAIRLRLATSPARPPAEVVAEVVNAQRMKVQHRQLSHRPRPTAPSRTVEWFLDAIQCLAEMPPARVAAASVPPGDAHRLEAIGPALRWLSEFAAEWEGRERLTDSA
jgi:hypothetical protein